MRVGDLLGSVILLLPAVPYGRRMGEHMIGNGIDGLFSVDQSICHFVKIMIKAVEKKA